MEKAKCKKTVLELEVKQFIHGRFANYGVFKTFLPS